MISLYEGNYLENAVKIFEKRFKIKMDVLWENRDTLKRDTLIFNKSYYSQVAEINVSF